MRYLALIAAVTMLVACQREVSCPAAAAPPAVQLPTASEVFHLRSECARLGDKTLGDAIIGAALTKDVTSNYDAHENRCYVDLTISTADLTVPINSTGYYQNRLLYDGQTHDLLASVQIKNGQRSGIVFHGNVGASGFDNVATYINGKMGN